MPVVDYQPLRKNSRTSVADLTCRWSFIALVPSLITIAIDFGFDPVGRHVLPTWAFNDYILPIAACACLAGFVLGIVSAATGSPKGAVMACINLMALLFLPSLMYA